MPSRSHVRLIGTCSNPDHGLAFKKHRGVGHNQTSDLGEWVLVAYLWAWNSLGDSKTTTKSHIGAHPTKVQALAVFLELQEAGLMTDEP